MTSLTDTNWKSLLNSPHSRILIRKVQKPEPPPFLQKVNRVINPSESCCFCQSAQIKPLNGDKVVWQSCGLRTENRFGHLQSRAGSVSVNKQTFQFGRKRSHKTTPCISLQWRVCGGRRFCWGASKWLWWLYALPLSALSATQFSLHKS